MNRTTCFALVFALALAAAACIQKDLRNVMYLQPDGSVVWTILETDVRSDAANASDRESEEAEYRRVMQSNPTPLVALLSSLGGRQASRTILKDTAPFEVHTSANFDRLDVLLENLCAAGSRFCVAWIQDQGHRRTLTLEMQGPLDPPAPEQEALIDALTDLKLVLVEGRFVEASGFILDGNRTARLDEHAVEDEDEPVTLTLVWETNSRQ
jgi:hypothetical protein